MFLRLPLRLLALLLVTAFAPALAACDSDGTADPVDNDIVALAQATPQLSTLVQALQAAGLADALQAAGPFTVFAPVNDAFAGLPDGVLDRLTADGNEAILQKILTYHVVAGELTASELSDGQTLTTLQGATLTVDIAGGVVRVNGARVVTADVDASNGVVHLIDGVLTENLDLVDVATVRGFSTLVAAVDAAGLTETLRTANGGAGFTVLAPTDAAFAALPAGTLDALLADPDALANVLLYHVASGTVRSGDLSDGQAVETLQGGPLTVSLGGGVTFTGAQNAASVVAADVAASNGVVHALDAVLLPPAE